MRFLLSQSVLFVPQASEPQPFRKRITLAWSAVIPNNVTSGRVTEGLHIADLNNDGPPSTSMNPVISDARSRDRRYIRGRQVFCRIDADDGEQPLKAVVGLEQNRRIQDSQE